MASTGTVGLLSSATAIAIGARGGSNDAGHMNSLSFSIPCFTAKVTRSSRRIICDVAIRSDSNSAADVSTSTSTDDEGAKIGARVKVKVPLKVYHVPKVPELDITSMEGELKQYVGLWKGKRISANLPFKVQFVVDIEGRGPVKFFAHLKEDEFDYV